MRLFIISLFALILSYGCATSYQKMGFTGGYQDKQLQADEFQVSFAGNVKLSQAKARQYALRRAAEVTVEHGFDYFVITSEGSFAKGFVAGNSYNGRGSVVGGSKPEVIITIKCGKGTKPETVTGAYNAKEFLNYAMQP